MSVIGLRVGPFEIARDVRLPAAGDWYEGQRRGNRHKSPQSVWIRMLTGDEEEPRAVQRVYTTLRAIDDPRVPRPVAIYEGIGALAVAAPAGEPLSAAVSARRRDELAMSPATLLDLALDLSEVLQHAHHRGKHHGGLWPGNVLLAADGQLVVWGFGDPQPAPAGWQAPEAEADPATDQWSLAALLAALITGRAVWPEGEPGPEADASALVEPIEAQWPALGRLLRRMLSRRARNRFANLHPVRQELLALAQRAGGVSSRRELATRLAEQAPRPTAVPEVTAPEAPAADPLPSAAAQTSPEAELPPDPADEDTDETHPPRPSPLPDEAMPVVRPHLAEDVPEARVSESQGNAPTAVPFTEEPTDSSEARTTVQTPVMAAQPAAASDPESQPTETPSPDRAAAPRVATVELEDSEELKQPPPRPTAQLPAGATERAAEEPTVRLRDIRPADVAEEQTGPTTLYDADRVAELARKARQQDEEIDLGIRDPAAVLDEDLMQVAPTEPIEEDSPPRPQPPGRTRIFDIALALVGLMLVAMVVWFAAAMLT